MKLSAWHKHLGDTVEWYMPFGERYDLVYMSKVFSFTPDYDLAVNADRVIRGGSGYAIRTVCGHETFVQPLHQPLNEIAEHMYPDYDLYPRLTKDTAYGFLTRGCPRGCPFCIVGEKEGRRSVKVADLSEFWRGQKKIVLCDPNILACKDWRILFRQLIASGAEIDFNQGLDIRLMTTEKANMIDAMHVSNVHFAWDNYEDKDIILRKLRMFDKNTVNKPHNHNGTVYVLTNYNTTFEQDLERIYTLRDMNYWPFVMVYDRENAGNEYRRLQRWCNNRAVFMSVDTFKDYKG
jgi:hypothetical protein